jgi:hypothetical protein
MLLYAGGYLTFYTPDQTPEVERVLPGPVALGELLTEIGIPAADVQLVILNLIGTQVQNQDVVKIFPGMDGG